MAEQEGSIIEYGRGMWEGGNNYNNNNIITIIYIIKNMICSINKTRNYSRGASCITCKNDCIATCFSKLVS